MWVWHYGSDTYNWQEEEEEEEEEEGEGEDIRDIVWLKSLHHRMMSALKTYYCRVNMIFRWKNRLEWCDGYVGFECGILDYYFLNL